MKLFTESLPLEKFQWDTKNGELTAFASDLGPLQDGYWWLTRLYDDACDMGITIESEKTRRSQTFCLIENEGLNPDGERWLFYFEPVDRNSRVKKVVIFND